MSPVAGYGGGLFLGEAIAENCLIIRNNAEDGVPDWWYHGYSLNPTSITVAIEDEDSFDNKSEWIALTDPTDSNSYFRVTDAQFTSSMAVMFDGSPLRRYSLARCDELSADSWLMVAGQTNVPGSGANTTLTDTHEAAFGAYRVRVTLP